MIRRIIAFASGEPLETPPFRPFHSAADGRLNEMPSGPARQAKTPTFTHSLVNAKGRQSARGSERSRKTTSRVATLNP